MVSDLTLFYKNAMCANVKSSEEGEFFRFLFTFAVCRDFV